MKIGIVTFNNAYNYGAFLQAYALQESIKKLNHQVEIIDYQNQSFNMKYKGFHELSFAKRCLKNFRLLLKPILKHKSWKSFDIRNKKFENSIKNDFILSKNLLNNTDDVNINFDYFISGSDQVWNVEITNNDPIYFLDFVNDNNKKLSYAASFGKDSFSEESYSFMENYLPKYNKLLVREKSGKAILKNRFGLESEVVLDPTLLLSQYEWINFSAKHKYKKKYLLIYMVEAPMNLPKVATEYAKEYNLDIVVLGTTIPFEYTKENTKAVVDADPHEFVDYFINAEAVFTTSFHGVAFSLNLNKVFYYELSADKAKANSRISDICSLLEVDKQEITSDKLSEHEINWSLVNEKLMSERKRSIKLLQEMIEAN